MNRERDDLPPEKDRQRGDKPAQEAEPDEGESGGETPSEKEVLVSLVDETIEAQDVEERVTDSVEPQIEIYEFSNDELDIPTVPDLKVSRTKEEVSNSVRPQQLLDQSSQQETQMKTEGQISVVDWVEVERTTVPSIKKVQPSEHIGLLEDVEVALMEELESVQANEKVSNMVKPSQTAGRLTGRKELFEIDETDPVFRWSGGSPFGSDRPKFVVHVDNGEISSLQFLQVLLRDTYKEIHGGEPGAETVEFAASEPRIPTVQRNIVTLNLRADEWEPSLRNNSPVIEGNGGDIVPKLRQIAGKLYTGELGYFVLNVPADFEHRYRRKGFYRKLVEVLADQEISEEQDSHSSLVEKVRASPVMLARAQTDDENTFFEKVSRYFSLTPVENGTSVAQVEEVYDRVLKKNDWRRVALTERQDDDGESNEHYFWKAAIADGLAWTMWEKNERGYNKFDPFLKDEILSKDVIETEKEDLNEVDAHPDIYIDGTHSREWVAEGLNEFIDANQDVDPPVSIEFETGRSEGAFNFRKIRDTLDKYSVPAVTVCLVVPNRVLFRGRKRADMIRKLVKTWNETNPTDAKLFTPVLEGGICTGLQPADGIIDELYGDENGE